MTNILLKSYEEFIAPYTVYETYDEADKFRPSEKGYEIHHIVPKATQEGYERGKKPEDDRCIILTTFNHILVHYLYCRDYPEEKSQFIALNLMCEKQAKELLTDEQKFLEQLPYLTKMREKGRENIYTEEVRKKISESKKGKNNPMYGKHPSEETRKKQSEAQKGEKHYLYGKHPSEEVRKKISESKKGKNNPMYGKHPSEETRKKRSEARKGKYKGEENPNYGKHPSKETRKKQSEARKGKYKGEENPNAKKVYQRDLQGNIINIFSTLKEAGSQLGKGRHTITNYLNGKIPKNLSYILSYN